VEGITSPVEPGAAPVEGDEAGVDDHADLDAIDVGDGAGGDLRRRGALERGVDADRP
jgi:hypothetical protein